MKAVEFIAELSGSGTLTIPPEIAAQLPNAGMARVIVLTAGDISENEDGPSLLGLAEHAESMGRLTNAEIDQAIYGG